MKIKLKYKNAVEIGPYTEDHGKGIVLYFHEKSKQRTFRTRMRTRFDLEHQGDS